MSGLIAIISSTARDLPRHRSAVMDACLSQDLRPKMMEHLPASDADAIQASLALVDAADLYIGVFGLRYGYVPEGHTSSITEMEYERAVERGIPRLLFLSHAEHLFTQAQVDTGPAAEKLQRLRQRLEGERVVAYFRSPEALRAAVGEALAKYLRERNSGEAASTVPEAAGLPRVQDNPYRNLDAFREEDAPRYFGREQLVRDTLDEFYALAAPGLKRTRLLAIIGPSGSGKSSFARAGVMTRLRREAVAGRALATLRPGEHPLTRLREAVDTACGEVSADPSGEGPGAAPPSPLASLPRGNCQSLVLLVDQFEEVWTQCESATERQSFIDALVDAASCESGRVFVLLTLRSDFLAETQRHPRINALVSQQAVLVPAMSAENLRRAIAEPARRAGHPLDEETIGRLIDDTLGKQGALPLLQVALTRIWNGMALGVAPAQTLHKLGGVGGALAQQAEEAYCALGEEERAIARRAFLAMVNLGEGAQDTRRRVALEQVAGTEARERVDAVLEQGKPPGLLWRPPLLTLLQAYYHRQPQDLHPEQVAFLRASEQAIEEAEAARERAAEVRRQALEQQRADAEQLARAAEELAAVQQRKKRQLGWFAAGSSLLALAALVVAGFLGFTLQRGQTPAQAWYALRLHAGLADPPQPELVEVPDGDFTMGSQGVSSYEQPVHPVNLGGFAIAAHEVTFAQYDAFAAMTGRPWPGDQGWGRENRPVINVSWHEAEAYAGWLGGRRIAGTSYAKVLLLWPARSRCEIQQRSAG